MQRCRSSLLLTLAITFVLTLTSCLGKNSSNLVNGGVATISLSPIGNVSIDVGGTQAFTASAKDDTGRIILGINIQFIVETASGSSPLSVASNGNGCAGTWDQTVSQCTPGTPGVATVTAVANGVSSPQVTVYVHQHIDNLQVSQAETQPPQYDCFSQGQQWLFQATAYNNNVDITNTVGPLSWTASNPQVAVALPYIPPQQPNVMNQVQVTAKNPGFTQLLGTVSGVTSAPIPFTTCLVQYLRLQITGSQVNSVTVAHGGAVSIDATAVDTLGNVIASPPLTWSTTDPEVAAFSTTTSSTGSNSATTRSNLGGANLFASCTPPSCNIGILPGLPIYASTGTLPNGQNGFGSVSVDVNSTAAAPIYTSWAATTGCDDQSGCTSSAFSITPPSTPTGNPINSIITLPRTPNSMLFNHLAAARIYFGSDQGLMYTDVTATSPSVTLVSSSSVPCNVAVCGKVLTISNDGKLVAVADNISTPHQVYVYNGNGSNAAPLDLVIPNDTVTAAAFSPDQLKLFILTDTGKMYIYSTVDALTSIPLPTTATDVEFSADGSFAYVAGAPNNGVSAYSTCSPASAPSVDIGTVATTTTPLQIFPLQSTQPNPPSLTQTVIAFEPPIIEYLTAQFQQVPVADTLPLPAHTQLTCNAPAMPSFTKGKSFNLGQGNFTPVYAQLVNDGNEMIIVGRNIPAVLVFSVSNGTTSSIALNPVNGSNPDPLAASASTDGSQVHVAACDQYAQDGVTCIAASVHLVNTCGNGSCNIAPVLGPGDFLEVPFININDNNNTNMCNGLGTGAPLCVPTLIAIKPQ